MDIRYFIKSKNFNLHKFPNSFFDAFKEFEDIPDQELLILNRPNVLLIAKKILGLRSSDTLSIFLFSTQPEYVLILLILRLLSHFSGRKRVKIYHQMHEPWYEKGRTNFKASFFGYAFNWMISRLTDVTIVPSDQAMRKAKTFIHASQLFQLNLTFPETFTVHELKDKVCFLKSSWHDCKHFSLIGGGGPDRNPEGFLKMSRLSQKYYPGRSRFIRAGRDKNVKPDYSGAGVVAFSSYIPENSKQFLLDLTHFIVVPYLFSTQSAVIPEALSSGKLVIVNDIPAFAYLKGLNFAFVVDFNDEKQLLKCLDEIQKITAADYERRFWSAISYFDHNHSAGYLSQHLRSLL